MNGRAPWFVALAAVAVIVMAACGGSKPAPTPPSNGSGSATEQPVEQTPGACASDEDCRLFSDYCTGCDCRALAKGEADPTCDGPGVRCIADPCMNKAATCQNGACVAVDKTPSP
jgi:hypothetical protein